jgi:hypothetical protein
VHGEPPAAKAMAEHLSKSFGWEATVPSLGAIFELNGSSGQ